ncbi:hypothetical protein [Mesorhizobium sp.]|uniref:hypothetical protein n=2 Tax=Mesorhizobium sp. TaxID=1871066 RepID=UPI00338FD2D3
MPPTGFGKEAMVRAEEFDMKPFALLPITLLGALALAAPVAAQTDNQTQDQAPAGHCQAQPQNGEQQPPPPVNNGDNNNLTETLDPCNGVLLPPPTGDQGMAAPPPDQGRTPVLKPGEVPAQPPKP